MKCKRLFFIVGNPGKQIGWMSEFGERIPLPLKGKQESFKCPNTNTKYELINDRMKKIII